MKHYDIVFNGPPDRKPAEFIEVNDDLGFSFQLGEWVQLAGSANWALRVPVVEENNDVRVFHQKFGIPMALAPSFLDVRTRNYRVDFMQEELDEFYDACEKKDLAGAADALVDLVYVAHGTALMMGLPWQKIWDEVQRANMSKERAKADGSNSKRRTGLDIVKPKGWVGPDHSKALGIFADANLVFNVTKRTCAHDWQKTDNFLIDHCSKCGQERA